MSKIAENSLRLENVSRGVEMRVTLPTLDGTVSLAMPDEPGDLEMRGSPGFTRDGWFKTCDRATIDPECNLNLIGRAKETLNINGVKHLAQDIEVILEQALASRVTRVICFPYRET